MRAPSNRRYAEQRRRDKGADRQAVDEEAARDQPGDAQWQDHLAKHAVPVGAEISRGLLEARRDTLDRGHDRQHHEGHENVHEPDHHRRLAVKQLDRLQPERHQRLVDQFLAAEWVRSFAIVTTTPNALCAELHNRMPAVLPPETWPTWLGEEPADPPQLKALFAPYPSEGMTCWPISARVGNVKNNDPSLIEPIALLV